MMFPIWSSSPAHGCRSSHWVANCSLCKSTLIRISRVPVFLMTGRAIRSMAARPMARSTGFRCTSPAICRSTIKTSSRKLASIVSLPPDDFLSAAKELTGGNVYGFAMNQDSGYSWPWYLQNKVHLYDAQKNVLTLDNDSAYEALQFQYDLIYKYKVAPVPLNTGSYDGPQKLFSAGRAAIILTGPWDIKPILTGSPNLHWDVAQALTHQTQSTYTAGSGLFIPKAAKNPDQAWELIKRLTTLNTELTATKEARMTMPRKSWGSNADVKQTPIISAFGQGLTYAEYDDALVKNVATTKVSAINSLFDKAFQDVIYKQAPVAQTLKDFVAAGNKILGS